MTRTPLFRASDDRLLAGVCGGLAAHLEVPVTVVRGGMLALVLLGGAGALLYLWFWVTVPRAGETAGVQPMRSALTKPAGSPAAPTPGVATQTPPTTTLPQADASAPAVIADPAGRAPAGPSAPGDGPGAPGFGSAAPGHGLVGRGSAERPVRPLGTAPLGTAPLSARAGSRLSGTAPDAALPQTAGGEPGQAPDPRQRSAPASERLAGLADGGDAASAPGENGPGGAETPSNRRRWPIAELLLGTCLVIAGIGFVLVRFGVELNLGVILPAMAVLVGVGLTWWQIADRDRPDRNQVPRVLGALALVAAGVLMFFVTAREPNAWTVVAAACAVLAGVALAVAPWLLRLNRELIAERAARAREAERSDIAAHLHDSVMQTLALIQQRSEPGSEVARIARGQERELREWLFRAADGAPQPQREAVGQELREHGAALEEEHSVRFEVVEVGSGDVAPEAIVAAAREAMLNAARHAGGDVTVYLEASGERISIDVTDRGPGLDPEALPADRMGVRESILGRMERAGGTARIVAGPGGGTSVRLSIARADAADGGTIGQEGNPDVQ